MFTNQKGFFQMIILIGLFALVLAIGVIFMFVVTIQHFLAGFIVSSIFMLITTLLCLITFIMVLQFIYWELKK